MYSALELLHTVTFLGRENIKCLIKYEDFSEGYNKHV
jgi:hypothetical protein